MSYYSLIDNGIFIGSRHAVIGNNFINDILDKEQISVVISALTEEEYDDYMIEESDFPNIDWHRLVIDDEDDEDISQYFHMAHSVIHNATKNGKKVIVHCSAGVSRSSTLVIAYFMIENNWGFKEAYEFVKKQRSIICPNDGFISQLRKLEEKLLGHNRI